MIQNTLYFHHLLMYCNIFKSIVYNAILKHFYCIYSYCIKVIAHIKKKWFISVCHFFTQVLKYQHVTMILVFNDMFLNHKICQTLQNITTCLPSTLLQLQASLSLRIRDFGCGFNSCYARNFAHSQRRTPESRSSWSPLWKPNNLQQISNL